MKTGWIKLHRSLAHHDLWLSEPFTRGQAWADLIMLANHKPGHIRRRGLYVTVNRGQVGRSQEELANRWRWSKGKVIRFLKELENGGRITKETELKNVAVTSLISITNYDQYQNCGTEDGTEDDTVNGPKTVPKTVLEQEVKKGKKEKKEKPAPSSEALRLSERLAGLILDNSPHNSSLIEGKRAASVLRWAEDLDKLNRIDKQSWEHIEEVMDWSQQDEFWKSNILSGGALRKSYDRLSAKMAVQEAKEREEYLKRRNTLYGVI